MQGIHSETPDRRVLHTPETHGGIAIPIASVRWAGWHAPFDHIAVQALKAHVLSKGDISGLHAYHHRQFPGELRLADDRKVTCEDLDLRWLAAWIDLRSKGRRYDDLLMMNWYELASPLAHVMRREQGRDYPQTRFDGPISQVARKWGDLHHCTADVFHKLLSNRNLIVLDLIRAGYLAGQFAASSSMPLVWSKARTGFVRKAYTLELDRDQLVFPAQSRPVCIG
jgi:hypothetical protein